MTFQSKISRTKKRLSDDRWAITAIIVAFFGLFSVLTFSLRAALMPGLYGVIPLEMPVVPATVEDPAYHRFKEIPDYSLRGATAAVVLTTEAFYFGDLDAFTTHFSDPRDKFMIQHVDGEPQLAHLVAYMSRWVADRASGPKAAADKVLVFIPAGDIPMPIVIQVVAGLRKSPHFQRVVLGAGLI